jgi:hypothetical protein
VVPGAVGSNPIFHPLKGSLNKTELKAISIIRDGFFRIGLFVFGNFIPTPQLTIKTLPFRAQKSMRARNSS